MFPPSAPAAEPRQPVARLPRRPTKALAIPNRVRITDGQSKGLAGVLVAEWPPYRGERQWVVEMADGRHVIREEFLEREAQ